ncbi:MAG: flagellar biosynthesis protein FlhB [Pseudomonadales bacterium]
MAEEQFQERTEPATPKRLQEARDKGQIARSRELNAMAVTLGGAVAIYLIGEGIVGGVATILEEGLALPRAAAFSPEVMLNHLAAAIRTAGTALAPWLMILATIAVLAPMSLGGWSFSVEALKFKGDRINPIAGIRRLFALRGLVELLKALAKFLVVGLVAILVLQWESDRFISLGRQSVEMALTHSAWLIAVAFVLMSAALILIAAVDVPFQIWDHGKKLRMTRQEVKDEMKETEGRPEVRSKVRSLQQEFSRRRMLEDIPIASVVVTNPTHYAVALRYEADEMNAPVVVAKGADHLALKIREIATEHGVPIFEAPPLARALYDSTEVGDEIAERLYVGVAQVLTYIYQLDTYLANGGREPGRPDVMIPEE